MNVFFTALLLSSATWVNGNAYLNEPDQPLSTAGTIDLGGSWTLRNATMKSVSATVPGQTHTDLYAAGVIGDPYDDMNQESQRWVALADWTYERSFNVTEDFLDHRVIQLVSLGIDTVATIYVNEQKVYYTDNMFHRIRLDVSTTLKAGTNTIRVEFTSKVQEAAKRASTCDNRTSLTCPSGKRSAVQHGFDNQNYLRTEPCSFSWDWGPGFAPMGLWRPIFLQAYDGAILRDITVVTTPFKASAEIVKSRYSNPAFYEPADAYLHNDTSEEAIIARAFKRTDRELDTTKWTADVTIYLDAGVDDAAPKSSLSRSHGSDKRLQSKQINGTVMVSFDGQPAVSVLASLTPGEDTSVSVKLTNLQNISAWMPNGFGSQKLYEISATFVPSSLSEKQLSLKKGFSIPYQTSDNVIKEKSGSTSVRTGFRTVELVQNPLPGGKSYFFRVNGVPIPVKGSNWFD